MSGRNTDVPSMVAAALPVPVAVGEYEKCPATDVLHRIGDKWTVLLVVLLGKRPYRFNELQRADQPAHADPHAAHPGPGRHRAANGVPYRAALGRIQRHRARPVAPGPAVSRRRLGGRASCRDRRGPAVRAYRYFLRSKRTPHPHVNLQPGATSSRHENPDPTGAVITRQAGAAGFGMRSAVTPSG